MVKPHGGFLLEHPETQDDGRLSIFDTPLWKSFATDSLMAVVSCVMNEKKVGLGGNMNLRGSTWPSRLAGSRFWTVPENINPARLSIGQQRGTLNCLGPRAMTRPRTERLKGLWVM